MHHLSHTVAGPFDLDSDDLQGRAEADFLAVIFDTARKTFRSEIYPEYKANRPPPPEELIPQFDLIREATRAYSLPCLEMEGFEADDLIATYARLAVEQGYDDRRGMDFVKVFYHSDLAPRAAEPAPPVAEPATA